MPHTPEDLSPWMPISSAPKDGTPIIIADIHEGQIYDVVHGYFEVLAEDEDDGPWSLDGGEPHCSYVGRAEGTYFCSWLPRKELDTRWRVTERFEYTHWIPARPGATSPTPALPAEREALIERLKAEAQIHAQEARTANSTIAEIYRMVTGGTGEPGNWNGAEPVRKCIEDLRAQVAALRPQSAPTDETLLADLSAFVKKIANGEVQDHMLSSLEDEASALHFRCRA